MRVYCKSEKWKGFTKGIHYECWEDSDGGYWIMDDRGQNRYLRFSLDEDWIFVREDPQFPVGTQCQARTQQNGFWCRWKDITVMGYYEDLIWFSHGDVNFTGELSQVELREKNSERERYVETAAPLLYHSYEPDEKGMEILAGHLYDLGFKLPDEETE